MKGFIRQRGAAWELRVFLGYDPVTAKQRYSYRTVHGGTAFGKRDSPLHRACPLGLDMYTCQRTDNRR